MPALLQQSISLMSSSMSFSHGTRQSIQLQKLPPGQTLYLHHLRQFLPPSLAHRVTSGFGSTHRLLCRLLIFAFRMAVFLVQCSVRRTSSITILEGRYTPPVRPRSNVHLVSILCPTAPNHWLIALTTSLMKSCPKETSCGCNSPPLTSSESKRRVPKKGQGLLVAGTAVLLGLRRMQRVRQSEVSNSGLMPNYIWMSVMPSPANLVFSPANASL